MKLIAPPTEAKIAFQSGFTLRQQILTPSEALFHHCLAQLSQDRCHIICKPRLADIFEHNDIAQRNKITQKHVDYLICRNHDWLPMLGIELDDDSHESKVRRERDFFVNNLFASVGLPLIRIHVREIDQVEALVQKLTRAWEHRWAALQGHQR